MDANVGMDVIEQLVKLQDLDRGRDRLQKRLDQVPKKLKKHTDLLAALDRQIAEQERTAVHLRADADRAELEVKTKEEQREKIKRQMNAPKLSNREYEVLQEQLAGVLADINSLSDQALKGMDAATEAEATAAALKKERAETEAKYLAEKERLESSLSGVTEELAKLDEERKGYTTEIEAEPLQIYERVRRKHADAMARVDGTIDRAAGRMGSDIHCAACYMAVTPNDAIHVLGRKRIVQCKSCVRILYVA